MIGTAESVTAVTTLTESSRDLLMFINARLATTGIAPSRRDMAARFGMSLGVAQREVGLLVECGYLRHPNRALALDVIRLPDCFVVRIT